MFTITTTDTSTGKILGTFKLETRTECLEWVRANVTEGRYHQVDEDPKPCRECGELCESQWSSYCKSCQFSLSEAVKASRKIIRSAKRHGNPVVSVWDGEDTIKGNERALLEAVHSVDFSRLQFQSGAWVAVICGEETEAECIPDYTLSVEMIVDDANLKDD